KLSRAELAALAPRFAWDDYFAAAGQGGIESLNVAWPDFFKGFETVLTIHEIPVLKIYLRWHLINRAAPWLSQALRAEGFAFPGRVLTGAKEARPRWKRCVQQINWMMGEDLGRAYVAAAFPPQTKDGTVAMIRTIEAAYAEDIAGLDWMMPETKTKALAKLASIANKVGYPDKWRDYSALEIVRGDALGNALRADGFEFQRGLARIGKPVDRAR